ncbi:restriction endonuclease subunit S [Streptococcus suis]|uniref:Restriction endonuclease subunit S n=1 Tax=Streptococcus suis TaxID=1307 RepID=A0A3R8MWR6_STRSU|nr:restriction endonuclease subunit S [Streptococcus suis]RRN48289.1 restriction endonuclease subunit S [Streptococcus suis]
MKTNNNIPAYRFQGYTDAWKQRKLGEVGYAKSGVGFPEKEQGGTTGIPFFKVSDMNTNGNENELVVANNYVTDEQISKRKWRVITEVPAIFFAKVGAAVMLNRKRLIRHPFLLDNNTMAYVFNHIQWETNFGKILFETIDLTQLTQVGALPSYNSSDVENINISLPTLPEQEAIGSFFSDLDQLITLHQHKLDTLKEQKKTYLKLLFPAKGQTKPALRFQGFEDDWKEVKLGEVVSISSGYTGDATLNNGKYKLTRIETISEGKVDVSRTGFSNELPDEKYRLNFGDILFSNINSLVHIGKVAIFNTMEEVFHGINLLRLVPNKDLINPYFIYYQLVTESKKNWSKAHANQAVNQASINQTSLSTQKISISSLPEQEVIGTFFQNLDQEIAQVEDKLASLKEMKKTLLRKLFV